MPLFRLQKSLRSILPTAAALACFWPSTAKADVSSWLFVGAGPSWTQEGKKAATERQLTLQLDTGIGTPPDAPIIVGGLGRFQTYFGQGSDIGLLVRTATQGFVNGNWGAAIDLGGYQRWWGIGSTGLTGSLVLGGPWGITLVGSGGFGTNDQKSYSAVLGIDFARLTIYRTSGDSFWKNPFPAYRPDEERH